MGFKKLDIEDLVISNDAITSPVWSNNVLTLNTFFTSSTQVTQSGDFYVDIYNINPTASNSEVQFSVAYGDVEGSGSVLYNEDINVFSPSKTTYEQYKNLILGNSSDYFIFNGEESKYIYILNIDRARYKESLLPGSFQLHFDVGSNKLYLIDDSSINNIPQFIEGGRVYNIIEAESNWQPKNDPTISISTYGYLLPDMGIIILGGEILDKSVGTGGINLNTDRSMPATEYSLANNVKKFIEKLTTFSLSSKETLSSNFIFIRARNGEFNYSKNPSFTQGNTGEVLYEQYVINPQTFITTIGLYNDNNELLATAKLSKPLQKDFTKELLVRCKLDF